MKIFNKENLDFFSNSPGNYIFKKKSNKSEFGKLSSILHLFISIIILIYFLYSYYIGSEKNIIYSKKSLNLLVISNEYKNDEYITYFNKLKKYRIEIVCGNNQNITGKDIKNSFNINIYNNKSDKIAQNNTTINNIYTINFTSKDPFEIFIENKTENFNCSYFIIEMLYTSSSINNEEYIPMKENKNTYYEMFVVNTQKKNLFYLNSNFIVYRDGIRLKKFKSYLKFWKHDETQYIDLIFNNYFSVNLDKINDLTAYISSKTLQDLKYYDFYQRNYESLFTTLSKWGGIFSILKIFFTSFVDTFSFSYNNYELVKYINKKYESNKILLNCSNNNNNNNNKEIKNIELNKKKVEKIKQFNKIKNTDIFKFSFLGCCYSKSKTHKIIKECNNYVTKHISIEEIFYNILLFENLIENYKFEDKYNLSKFDEIKNKIDLYEKEMKIKDSNDTSNKSISNFNIDLIEQTSNLSSINDYNNQ